MNSTSMHMILQLNQIDFKFYEWDLHPGSNVLKLRAEEYCTKKRLHTSDMNCVLQLISAAVEMIKRINSDFEEELIVGNHVFSYSKQLHVKTNRLFRRALSFCDYFGYEQFNIDRDVIEKTSCSYQIYETVMKDHMNVANLTIATSGIEI